MPRTPMPRILPHSLLQWSCLAALLAIFALPVASQTEKPDMPRSERHESKHEIDQLEEVWRNAVLHRDATGLAPLLSDDYIGITGNGTLQSREDTLASMRSGTMQFTQMDLFDRKVRFYGQTALVTSRAEVNGVSLGNPIHGSYRYTRVYARDNRGAWKIVSFEASPIR